ncbi:hypothetical protein HNP55_003890 [Paucibacter oligotrophus]|uniref:Uncharacterized protein n=1 Tax=Roseateles oligotrophus TaxID=1769250 RepID=A0A840LFC5_9BURK|nr:hypothetical protein [Roseateles oligotrophus]
MHFAGQARAFAFGGLLGRRLLSRSQGSGLLGFALGASRSDPGSGASALCFSLCLGLEF